MSIWTDVPNKVEMTGSKLNILFVLFVLWRWICDIVSALLPHVYILLPSEVLHLQRVSYNLGHGNFHYKLILIT